MRRAKFITGLDDFSEGAKIEDCTFQLIKTVGGEYLVDTIYKNSVKPNIENQVYSYEQLLSMNNFIIRENGLRKKYKTATGVIRKLKQIRRTTN